MAKHKRDRAASRPSAPGPADVLAQAAAAEPAPVTPAATPAPAVVEPALLLRWGRSGDFTSEPLPFYQKPDWLAFSAAALATLLVYFFTLAPNLTPEDSGELATASMYAGVPHAPGYPLWTIYTWLFTVLVPTGSIAWRVGLSSAVAAALSCGLVALMISRGSRLLLSPSGFAGLESSTRNAIGVVAGFAGGAIFGFTGPMWSQAVIVEVYTLSTFTFVAVLALMMRWFFAPERNGPLYAAGLLFGLCLANHQTLLLAAVGLEVIILLRRREIGRDFFLFNTLVYLAGLLWMSRNEVADTQHSKLLMFGLFNLIGVGGMLLALWHLLPAQGAPSVSGLLLAGAFALSALLIAFCWSAFVGPLSQALPSSHEVWNLKAVWSTYYKFADRMLLSLAMLLLGGAIGLLLHAALSADNRSPRSWLCVILIGSFTLLALLWVHQLLSSRGIVAGNLAGIAQEWRRMAAAHVTAANKLSAAFVLLAVGLLSWACLRAFGRSLPGALPLQQWRPLTGFILAALAGVSFYLFMPLSSLTNPPMNWAYPRMAQGLKHAVTRGQYTNPSQETSDSFSRVLVDWDGNGVADGGQVGIFVDETLQEFYPAYLLLGLLPFLCWRYLGPRERRWLAGIAILFASLTLLLIIFRNIEGAEQQRHLNKVFFESAHVFVALGVGWGLALALGMAMCRWVEARKPLLIGAAVLMGLELCWWPFSQTAISAAPMSVLHAFSRYEAPLLQAAPLLGAMLFGLVLLALVLRPSRAPLALLLSCASLFPARHALSNWWDNELAGHYFGYWYGRDMFAPPVTGGDARPLYPAMARDAVLFGGTDAGRFCPTYMIFCESLVAPKHRTDASFDRRDVFIITQNALADATYLQYIRAHYNRSRQFDESFLKTLVADPESAGGLTEQFNRQQAAIDAEFKGPASSINSDMNSLLASLDETLSKIQIPPTVDPKNLIGRLEWTANNLPAGNPYRQQAQALHMKAIQLSSQLGDLTNDWNGRLLESRLSFDRALSEERLFGGRRFAARAVAPMDAALDTFGESVERDRRAGSSLLRTQDILDMARLRDQLLDSSNPVSAWILPLLTERTRQRLSAKDVSTHGRESLVDDLNQILQSEVRHHLEQRKALAGLDLSERRLLHANWSGFEPQALSPLSAHVADRELAIQQLLRFCDLPADGTNHLERLKQNVRTNDSRLLDLCSQNPGLADDTSLAQSIQERARIVEGLCRSRLYDPARFAAVAFDAETSRLLHQNPYSDARIRLNRLLLQAAFPGCFRAAPAGVYPAREIYIPTVHDLQASHERARSTASTTDEAVWAINGDLTEITFRQNPGHEFYVEESLALDWMYPHLVPYGIIFKIERESQHEWPPEKLDAILARDRAFWLGYARQLNGDIVQPDTPVDTIARWADRVFLRRDHTGHTPGQRRFLRDYVAQRAFAKLRVSIAQLYAWRARQCQEQIRQINALPAASQPPEAARLLRLQQQQERLLAEADFAYRQSFAFCPSSPEAPYRYLSFLLEQKGGTLDDRAAKARVLIESTLRMDPSDLRAREGMMGLVRHHARSQFALSDPEGALKLARLGGVMDSRFLSGDPILGACVLIHQLLQENRAQEAQAYTKEIQHLLQPGGIGQMAVAGVFAAYQKKALSATVSQLEQAWKKDPTNPMAAYSLIQAYRTLNRTTDIRRFAESTAAPTNASAPLLVLCAHAYQTLGDSEHEQGVRERIAQLTPERPDAWYDLAVVQNKRGQTNGALLSLKQAWEKAGPGASRVNIRQWIRTTNSLDNLRGLPEFKALVGTNAP